VAVGTGGTVVVAAGGRRGEVVVFRKLAVTVAFASTFRMHVLPLALLHAAPQPVKVEPPCGRAVSVTVVNEPEQSGGQLMPVGLLVTLPCPLTLTLTVRRSDWASVEVAAEVAEANTNIIAVSPTADSRIRCRFAVVMNTASASPRAPESPGHPYQPSNPRRFPLSR
jgi:hypothetical protein